MNDMLCKKCEDVQKKLSYSPGDKVEIYLDTVFEGVGTLIQRKESWSDSPPFPINPDDECDPINAVTRTWVVELQPTKFDVPYRVCRKIVEYHSCGQLPEEDLDEDEEE